MHATVFSTHQAVAAAKYKVRYYVHMGKILFKLYYKFLKIKCINMCI